MNYKTIKSIIISVVIYLIIFFVWNLIVDHVLSGGNHVPPVWYQLADGIVRPILILGPPFLAAALNKSHGLVIGIITGGACYLVSMMIINLTSSNDLLSLTGLLLTIFGLISNAIYSAVAGLAGQYCSCHIFNHKSNKVALSRTST